MYESWFGFTTRPFVAAPQVDGYYPAEVNESALQALIWCVERGAGPGVVVGATGTGKTTLALMIQQYFKAMMPVALISGGTCKTSRALLQNMLYAFSLPYEDSDEGQLRLSLTEFFRSRSEGRGSLLIVDEADKLDESKLEEIRAFADLTSENGWAVHVVLVGSPRLEEKLAMPILMALNQRVATRCYLTTWNKTETSNYINQQFQRVGAGNAVAFDESAIQQIAESTGGVPRLVNQLCDHALMLGAAAGVHELDAFGIQEAWAALQNLPAPTPVSTVAFDNAMDESIIEFGSLDGDESESPAFAPTWDSPAGLDDSHTGNEDDHDEQLAGGTFQPAIEDFVVVTEDSHDLPRDNEAQVAEYGEVEATSPHLDEADVISPFSSESSVLSAVNAVPVEEQRHDPIVATDFNDRDPEMVAGTMATNPFLEEFESEEIVIGRVMRISDETAILTDHVRTEEGQTLASVLNLIGMTQETTSSPGSTRNSEIERQVETQNQLARSTSETPTQIIATTSEFGFTTQGENASVDLAEETADRDYSQVVISSPSFGQHSDSPIEHGNAAITAAQDVEFAEELDAAPVVMETVETGESAEEFDSEPATCESTHELTINDLAMNQPVEETAAVLTIRADEPAKAAAKVPSQKSKRFGRLFTRLSQQ